MPSTKQTSLIPCLGLNTSKVLCAIAMTSSFFFVRFGRVKRCETNGASSVGSARPAESQMSKTILHWTLGSKYLFFSNHVSTMVKKSQHQKLLQKDFCFGRNTCNGVRSRHLWSQSPRWRLIISSVQRYGLILMDRRNDHRATVFCLIRGTMFTIQKGRQI